MSKEAKKARHLRFRVPAHPPRPGFSPMAYTPRPRITNEERAERDRKIAMLPEGPISVQDLADVGLL
jgi:hypothetical protein